MENWDSIPGTIKGRYVLETLIIFFGLHHTDWEESFPQNTLFGRNENRKKCIVHFRVPNSVDFFKSLD